MQKRIRRKFRNYLELKRSSQVERTRLWIRNSLSVMPHTLLYQQKKQASALLKSFLETGAASYKAKKTVLDFRDRVFFIQLQVKKMIVIR